MPDYLIRLLLAAILFLVCHSPASWAQSNDCATATTICSNPPAAGNPAGEGGFDDFSDPDNDPGCLTSEGNTAWYYFEIDPNAPGGLELGFTIIPDGGYGEDYDWALFGPDVDCGDLGSPIRCSSASAFCAFCPETGMGMGTTDYSEGPGFGDGFVATLDVSGGQGFYIAINNWYGTGNGFTLEFTGSAAPWLDCTADPPCSVIADAGPDMTVCEAADPFNLQASGDGGLPPYVFLWSGSGNGTDYLDNPDTQNPLVTLPSGVDGSITYYVTVTDGYCESVDSMVLTIWPAPEVMINPLGPLCTDDVGTVQATGNPPNGTWGGIADNQGIIVPASYQAGTYWVTLSTVSAQGCPGTDSLAVQILDPDPIQITPIPPLCSSSDPVTIDVTPPGGIWTGDFGASGIVFPDLLGPGAFVGYYEYYNLYGCRSTAYIVVDIFADPEPEITDPGPVCSDQSAYQLLADPLGGTWSGVAQANGLIAPTSLGAGFHEVHYFYIDNQGCEGKDSLFIEIVDPPTADLLPAVQICNSDAGGQNTVLDFTSLILSGDPGGTWTDIQLSGAMGSPPVLDFNGVPPGSYTFQYTTASAQGDCAEFEGFVEVIVEECNCPSVAVISSTAWCNLEDSLNLQTLKITTESGTWQLLATPPGVNPASLNGGFLHTNGRDPGPYILSFTLSTPPPAGCPDRDTAQVQLQRPPFAQIPDSTFVCNNLGTGNHPTVVDLYTLVSNGDSNGIWTIPPGFGITGPDTAVNFQGVVPGVYPFTYQTNSATAPCPETSYSVFIVVEDCQCPSLEMSGPPPLCTDQAILDLQTLPLTSESGTWSLIGVPPGTYPATLNGSIFHGTGHDPGSYSVRFSLVQTPPAGCPDHIDLTLNLLAPPFADLLMQLSVCNTHGQPQDTTQLDFGQFIQAGDSSGFWTDISGSGAAGTFPLLDFNGLSPGFYPFMYTTQSASPPCQEQTYTVNVLVKNCLCPDLDLLPSISLCNREESLDLQDMIQAADPGTWSFPGAPGSPGPELVGSELFIQGATPGSYTLVYTLSDIPPPGCPVSADVQVQLSGQPDPGYQWQSISICQNTAVGVQLDEALTNFDPGGLWTFEGDPTTLGSAFQPLSGTLQTDGLTPGSYTFRYSLSASPPCKDTSSLVTIEILPLPPVSAGADATLSCQTTTAPLGDTPPLPGLIYFWEGPGIINPGQAQQLVDKPGLYVLAVTDPLTGCIHLDSVQVQFEGTPMTSLAVDISPTACPEASNGMLTISSVYGGTPPFMYRIDGGTWQNELQFQGLAAGAYHLEIEDAYGCQMDSNISIPPGQGFQVSLGEDMEVYAGTLVPVIPVLYPSATNVVQWSWTPVPPGCQGCEKFDFLADLDAQFNLTAVDQFGCISSDDLIIRVIRLKKVYIPNAFSPDGDGINDMFFIHGGSEVSRVTSFRVFDRWGNALFEKKDLAPDDPSNGWDGAYRGRPVEKDVYVYAIEISFLDGTSRLYKGDVLVTSSLPR